MAEAFPFEFGDTTLLYLMLAEPVRINDMNLSVIRKILESGCIPLVVTVNQPYKVLARQYARQGIDMEKIYVIDTVTQYSGGECVHSPFVRYVNNPSNLTDLGIAITETMKKMPGEKKCILFDSVSMLLIHIPSVTASKFFHFVVNKLKLSGSSGIFLSVERGLDPVILSQMSAFVDRVVDYGGPGTGQQATT